MRWLTLALMGEMLAVVFGMSVVPKAQSDGLEGSWQVVSFASDGEKGSADEAKTYKVFFSKQGFKVVKNGEVIQEGTYTINLTKNPKAIDLVFVKGGASEGKTALGIFSIKDDDLSICFNAPSNDRPQEEERPREFSSTDEAKTWLNVYKRERP